MVSIIIAGVFLVYAGSSTGAVEKLSVRLVGRQEGARFVEMSGATIRSVAQGVLGVAVIQSILAGIGLLVWCAGVVGSIDNFLRPVLVGRDTKMPDLLILLSTLGGVALFGASGLVLGPILAALFLTVLAMYSRVFADWLNVDQPPADPSSQ